MLRRSNWQYSLAFVILAIALGIMFSSISIAATSNSGSFVADYETSWIGGIVNSTNFNGSITGGIFAGNANSTNYTTALGIGAASVESTTTTTTTTLTTTATTLPEPSFSTITFIALDNKISSITVASGVTVSMSNFKNMPLSTLNFKTNKSLSGGVVSAKKIEEIELTVPRPAEKNYDFIEIIKTNINDTAINSAKIKFAVTKAWMTENNITEERVVLQRYEGTGWRKLPTKKVSSDATTITYESESPGLSIFAISGLPPGETPPVSGSSGTTTTTVPETTTTTTIPTTTTTTQQEIVIPIGGGEGFKIPIGLALAAGIIIIVVAVVILRKKQPK